jgi:hypothetical protein
MLLASAAHHASEALSSMELAVMSEAGGADSWAELERAGSAPRNLAEAALPSTASVGGGQTPKYVELTIVIKSQLGRPSPPPPPPPLLLRNCCISS